MRLRLEFHLVASIGAHGLVLLAVGWFASTGSPPLAAVEAIPVEISLDDEFASISGQPSESVGVTETERQSVAPASPGRVTGMSAQQAGHPSTWGATAIPGTSPDVPSSQQDGAGNGQPGQAPGGGPGPKQAAGPIDLGLGTGAFWPRAQEPDKPLAPRPASTTGGLLEAIREHDVAIGLGAGGPVVSAARTSAQSSAAMGSAMMVITSDETGRVISVQLSGASYDRELWGGVANAMLASLRSIRLRVPSGARGVVVSLQIEASNRLPSGAKGGPSVTGLGPVVSGQFDLSDIGQKPARVVRTRVIAERTI